jgi:quinol monooxygenase YgiN
MLCQSVHYTFAPEDADKAEALLRELRAASRKEDGVITFEIARSQDQPNSFTLWEEYTDRAGLEAHAATEHFKRLVINGIRPLAKERNAVTGFPIADS